MAVLLLVAAVVALAVSVVYLGASFKQSAAEGVTSLIRERLGRSWVSQGFKIAIVSWQIVSQASGGSIPSRRRYETPNKAVGDLFDLLVSNFRVCFSAFFFFNLPRYYYIMTGRMHAPEGFIQRLCISSFVTSN